MSRRARIVLAGVPHHVTQRGNHRQQVFFDDAGRLAYLDWLRLYAAEEAVSLLAYCLMPNHIHLVAVPARPDSLHRSLKSLHGRYAHRVNRERAWAGHLWQGRFSSTPMDESHLWAAVRYVELNPVRAGLVALAQHYRWSSAAAHCGLRQDPVLSADARWQPQVEAVGDWSAWLTAAAGDTQETVPSHQCR